MPEDAQPQIAEQPTARSNWLARIILAQDAADTLVSRRLADQLRRSLLTDFNALPRPGEETPELGNIYDQAVELLTSSAAPWSDIYQAQMIYAHLVPEDRLDSTLARKLEEAETLKIDTARVRQRTTPRDDHTPTVAAKRDTLVSIVSEVQWERRKRYLCRHLRACYVKRTCYLTLFVGPFFFLSLMWTVWANDPESPIFGFLSDNMRYPGLVVATASGILGAWFSMLVSTDKRLSGLTLDELRVVQRLISLVGRLIFGAASAVIFYFLLKSELVQGDFLPKVHEIGFEQITGDKTMREIAMDEEMSTNLGSWLPSKNLCLLIVWGVICGFSEKLIPAALTRHSDGMNNETAAS